MPSLHTCSSKPFFFIILLSTNQQLVAFLAHKLHIVPFLQFFFYEMTVHLHVFGSIMMNWIVCYINS
uniref:Uncharacterized protein n=1 Tax=Cannabis sativa TaxID=3483 RepID=A0A803R9D8_CANSA